jgi:hypothetical protein
MIRGAQSGRLIALERGQQAGQFPDEPDQFPGQGHLDPVVISTSCFRLSALSFFSTRPRSEEQVPSLCTRPHGTSAEAQEIEVL